MQGAQILRNEAYIEVRCNDEGCSATQQNFERLQKEGSGGAELEFAPP